MAVPPSSRWRGATRALRGRQPTAGAASSLDEAEAALATVEPQSWALSDCTQAEATIARLRAELPVAR